MPLPSYTQTLGSSLGPDITIIEGGDLFSEEESDHSALDIKTMNEEMASLSEKDGIIFLNETPKEDVPLRSFLESQQKRGGLRKDHT